MRLKIQVGSTEVDVGAKVQQGLEELDRIRREQTEGLKRFRSRNAPTEKKVVAGLNRVMESLGYKLVPKKSGATATPQRGTSTKSPAPPKAPAKRRS